MNNFQGCHTAWGNRMMWDPCDECGHMLIAHKPATKECSVCELDVWRDVAIALVSEIANELLDPNSLAMQAYNHARNHRSGLAREFALLAADPTPKIPDVCPECNGSGMVASRLNDGSWEPYECDGCNGIGVAP